jgi:hypothetical protein
MSNAVVQMLGHEFQLETTKIGGDGHLECFANSNKCVDLHKRGTLSLVCEIASLDSVSASYRASDEI